MTIELAHVSHTYLPGTPQAVLALDDVSVVIPAGQFVALIGPTGSGKSTLAQTLNGLISPTQGSITIDGVQITSPEGRRGLRSLRQRVGMVFQFPEYQLFEDSVLADVSFGPRNLGLPADETRERAIAALRAVGLEGDDIIARSPFALSGGQMRRVAIAGVLAMDPKILVLDEPAVGLDPHGREEILGQIRDLHQRLGLTVILVSHDMQDVARLADRLLVMAAGRLVMDGSPGEIFGRGEALRSLGLDVPVLSGIMQSLRAHGWQLPVSVRDVDEAAELIVQAWHAGGGLRP